ncbi:MAG: type II toxin-antitoxin system MqsA family antitoxin [Saprospiraceae bacterium]|nr:type II toxin-antitoxin system MqsA family antitoxin [Saprospiraceae bacterium]
MKCIVCKTGETHPGKTTVTLRRDQTVVVVEDVNALICDNCGHYYLDSPTTKKVMDTLTDAIARGTKLEILAMKAAA